MGYRDVLTLQPETVQDLEISAPRRLDEASELWLAHQPHSAIYLAGLAAEMYLKTACFFVGGAAPAVLVLSARHPGAMHPQAAVQLGINAHGLQLTGSC